MFSIPPSVGFLTTFAQALVAGAIVPDFPKSDDPLGFADATIYVPTRRAARALADTLGAAFGQRYGFATALLPRIVPLGQIEGLETNLLFQADDMTDAYATDLPVSVSPLHRRLVLSNFVMQWARALKSAMLHPKDMVEGVGELEGALVAPSAIQAWSLSGDLASLIDEMIIEGVPWTALETLNPDAFDTYWSLTTQFLQIAATAWPNYLRDNQAMEAAARQAELAQREAARLGAGRDARPIIALGSTGTNRATAELLAAIAQAPRGAVVLPGLDLAMDEDTWRLVGARDAAQMQPAASHPQAALYRLLPILKIDRRDVVELGQSSPTLRARTRFLSDAFLPADATERWHDLGKSQTARGELANALADMTLLEAADEREEALALAITLRDVLETPGATAALITPDRTLAKRVQAELLRWNIEIDDSGGDSLGTLPAGRLAHGVIASSGSLEEPHNLLALLEHPWVRLGFDRPRLEALKHHLDVAVLRQVALPGEDLATTLARARDASQDRFAHPAVKRLTQADWNDITLVLTRLAETLKPWELLAAQGKRLPLASWVDVHRTACAQVMCENFDVWDKDNFDWPLSQDGQALAEIFEALWQHSHASPTLTAQDYLFFLTAILRETPVRGQGRTHPRLKILGLLEARLLQEDLMLLAGLDETIWPPPARTDAFLNRPMRASLGLSPPERRIGQTAHDFVQAMGEGRVVISRAIKRGGAPTVPSRFLQRMAALAGETAWTACRARGEATLQLARQLDAPTGKVISLPRPSPSPPVELRPSQLSVTRIESLRRDPYAIYAEFILQLQPLGDLGQTLGPREYGIALHAIVEEFVKAAPIDSWPSEPENLLQTLAEKHLKAFFADPVWMLFEWPQVQNFLQTYLAFETQRRAHIRAIHMEQRGVASIPLSDGTLFKLTGTADRIEHRADGSFSLIDFKRKNIPSKAVIAAGFAPQLPLEAWMLARGDFAAIRLKPPLAIHEVIHIPLLGEKSFQATSVAGDKSLDDLVAEHEEGLLQLLNQTREPGFAYPPRPYPQFVRAYNPYDHLSRVKEWSAGSSEGEA